MKDIFIKNASMDIFFELSSIGFDSSYINHASKKYSGRLFKLFNLKPHEANILKQICLSLGFDCAVSRDTVTCKCEYTNCLIFATYSQILNLIEKLKKQPFRLSKISELISDIYLHELSPIVINDSIFDWKRPYIMGVLNVTPDSFSDGGLYCDVKSAINHVYKQIEDGADIIDIGGESTRPNSDTISPECEVKRILPVIEEIRKNKINIPISIDTRNYLTAKSAIDAGADIINDVSGLSYDKNLFDFVVKNQVPVIIVHSDSVPAKSEDYTNNDIVEQTYIELLKKIELLVQSGLDKTKIIVDPGVGFGKNSVSSFDLLKRIDEFTSLNTPLLMGISRKSFITNTFNISNEKADVPTALYSSITKSINIHRVHNVKLTKQYIDFVSKLL